MIKRVYLFFIALFVTIPFYVIFFVGLFGFLWLQIGVEFKDELNFSNVKIEDLKLKYNNQTNKVSLKIGSVVVSKSEQEKSEDNSSINYDLIRKGFEEFQNFVELVEIQNIKYAEQENIYFSYNKLDQKYFVVKNRDISANLRLKIDEKNRIVTFIENLNYSPYQIKANGFLIYDLNNSNLSANLKTSIADEVELKTIATLNKNSDVQVKISSNKFSDLQKVVPLFSESPALKKHLLENKLNGSLQIKRAKTNFNISQPLKALDNLDAQINIENLAYKFDKNLFPIFSEKMEIEYKNSTVKVESIKLNLQDIQLKNTKVLLSNLFGDLKIDILTTTKAVLNNYLIEVLKNYGVKDLPVTQMAGKIELSSHIILDFKKKLKQKISVNGKIKKATFKFQNQEFLIYNSEFKYIDNLISLKNLYLKFSDLVTIFLKGEINLNLKNLDLRGKLINLDFQNSENNSSVVKLNNQPYFSVKGNFNKSINLYLNQTNFNIAPDLNLDISPIYISYQNNRVYLSKIKNINLNKFDTALDLRGYFDISKSFARLYLNIQKSHLETESEKIYEFKDQKLTLTLNLKNESVQLKIDELDLSFQLNKLTNKILLNLANISKVVDNVPVAYKYGLRGGQADISIDENKNINLLTDLIVNQEIIKNHQSNKKIQNFKIQAQINDKNITANINEKIFINRQAKLNTQVLIDGYDINVTAIKDMFASNSEEEKPKDSEEKFTFKTPENIEVQYINSDIYLTDSNVLPSENIYLSAKDNRAFLFTRYNKNDIYFELVDDRFIFKGLEISEKFIKKLSGFDGFKRGKFNFYFQGDLEKAEGLVQFQDFVLKNFSIYNNILSFINTVPALLTFSRPGFNTDGFVIIAGFILIKRDNDLIEIPDFKIYGESTNVFGNGKIDLNKKTLDFQIDISAIKYVDQLIGKIPIADWIVLGSDNSLATSLKITGTFSKPKISTDIHKDILSTPFEVVKRVFSLPQYILMGIREFYSGH